MERPGPGLPRSGEGLAAKRAGCSPSPAAETGEKSRPLSRQSWLRWGKPSGGLILTSWELAKGAEGRCARQFFPCIFLWNSRGIYV